MTIYIDKNYKCHVSDDGTRRAFDIPFFDGKIPEFVEGYRYVPSGETWTRPDGKKFSGEMCSPWKDYFSLYIAQLKFELQDADNALAELGVEIDG